MNPRKFFGFTGNLGADPELSTTKTGRSYCRFSLCVNTRYKDKNSGETKKVSEWFYPVIWGVRAETFAKIAKKGSLVQITGNPTANSVEDPQSGKKYNTPGFAVDSFEILTYGKDSENSNSDNNGYNASGASSAKSESSSTPTQETRSNPSAGGPMISENEEASDDKIDYDLGGDEDNSFAEALDGDDEIPF